MMVSVGIAKLLFSQRANSRDSYASPIIRVTERSEAINRRNLGEQAVNNPAYGYENTQIRDASLSGVNVLVA